jgi:hypothetical protein
LTLLMAVASGSFASLERKRNKACNSLGVVMSNVEIISRKTTFHQ